MRWQLVGSPVAVPQLRSRRLLPLLANEHATNIFRKTHDPLVQSFEPDEDWRWCYVDGIALEPARLQKANDDETSRF